MSTKLIFVITSFTIQLKVYQGTYIGRDVIIAKNNDRKGALGYFWLEIYPRDIVDIKYSHIAFVCYRKQK